MSDKSALFDLITSLTQSEKRYFARFATLYTSRRDHAYLTLFNRLCGMKRYRTNVLKSEFGAKHYEQLKRQLFNKILEALRLYHEKKSGWNAACVSYANSEILQRKGIERMQEREGKHAELAAAKAGLQAMELYFRERRASSSLLTSTPEHLGELQKEHAIRSARLLDEVKEISLYTGLLIEVEILNRKFEGTRSESDLELINRFLNNKLLKSSVKPVTPRAQLLYFFCKGLAHYLRFEFATTAEYMDQAYRCLLRFPYLREQDPVIAIRVTANRALSYYHAGNRSRYLQCMTDLTRLKEEDKNLRKYLDEIILILELKDLNGQEQYQQAARKIRSAQEVFGGTLRKHQATQQEIYFAYQEVIALHGAGELRKASAVIARFISDYGKHLKEDAYVTARIVFLLLRFEMEDETLTLSELRSVPSDLLRRQKFYQVEREVVRYVSQMMALSTVADRRRRTREFIRQLAGLKQVPFERNAFMYFDFQKWAEKYAMKL